MSDVLSMELGSDGVAVLTIDDEDDEVNTLKPAMAEEFETRLRELEQAPGVRALILRSGKPDAFIAGADLQLLQSVTEADEARELSRLSQEVNARVASLPVVTVAAIHGAALGGGLELALAFDARIASDAAVTRLGLPEVQLGLLPGGGGTQRLTRLIGLEQALPMLLAGRQLRAGQALELGLVDRVTSASDLMHEARRLALALADDGSAADRPARQGWPARARRWLTSGNSVGRAVVLRRARASVRARTGGHYPAPEAIIDVVARGFDEGLEHGLAAEARAFGDLAVSDVARNLIGLFFDDRALRHSGDGATPRAIERLAVVGAGLMGQGIAEVSALGAGLQVSLHDRDPGAVQRALAATSAALERRRRRGALLPRECEEAAGRLTAGGEAELARAQLVIEAVVEDLEVKRQVLAEVESVCEPVTLFASNTSSLPLVGIAAGAARPENVVGMHYFSPVQRMPLLEVVRTALTAPDAVATAVATGRAQGKTVIVVRDGPGFFTSRILAPYLNEAGWLLLDGFSVEQVDRALVEFGFPVGPFALLDEVGIDVAGRVAEILGEHLGTRMQPPEAMQALQRDNRRGRKNARGFYRHGGRRRGAREVDASVYEVLGVRPRRSTQPQEIVQRCVLQMVNEVALCVQEGVVETARDADVGAVFGLGFPPFLGGPLRYVDARGVMTVVSERAALGARLGARFATAELLEAAARDGSKLRVD
jgi:3-hydroxyacyl-CoA dehydrogenase/enoyl-CoA hydratase/3-hydroxybutyryl-CoA epimerase